MIAKFNRDNDKEKETKSSDLVSDITFQEETDKPKHKYINMFEKKRRREKVNAVVETIGLLGGVAAGLFLGVGMPKIDNSKDATYGTQARTQMKQEYDEDKISQEQYDEYCVRLEQFDKGTNTVIALVTPLAVSCFSFVSLATAGLLCGDFELFKYL